MGICCMSQGTETGFLYQARVVGWGGAGGRVMREGRYVHLWLIHVDVCQKTTKFCNEIILQLKKINSYKIKLNKLGYEFLPHHYIQLTSGQLTTTSSSILTTFFQGKCFYNQQETENAFQEFVKFRNMDFYVTGINKHFSLAKMCWL